MVGQQATEPEELTRLFLERANAGDVDGVVALYEPDAVLVGAPGHPVVGREGIRGFYAELFAAGATFGGDPGPVLRAGDLALTSTRLALPDVASDGRPTTRRTATTEVARRQPDGTWLWAIDNPDVLP